MKTHKYMSGQNAELLIVKTCGIYSYYCVLKGYSPIYENVDTIFIYVKNRPIS